MIFITLIIEYGVSGTGQDATRLRHHRKNVSGLSQVFRPRVRGDGSLDGLGAVVRRDPGRDALGRLDRNRERHPKDLRQSC